VDFEFDPAKDAVNREKHGVSLVLGAAVLMNLVGEMLDDRRSCGEIRMNAFGLVQVRLYACTYTAREGRIRLISVRKTNTREQKRWLP
jgi:uncharacterized DUF497 family protein